MRHEATQDEARPSADPLAGITDYVVGPPYRVTKT
jgi:hypothetical protein